MGDVVLLRPALPFHRPGEPRRVRPAIGRQLTMADVRGEWYASCTVAACGLFAVVWSTPSGTCWAPLHDFAAVDLQRVLAACRRHDEMNDPERLPWPRRRYD